MPALGSNCKNTLSLSLVALLLLPAPMMAAKSKPQYLPPIAPTLDTSATKPAAAASEPTVDDLMPAPAPSAFSSESSAAAPASTSNDKVKSLMRQALMAHNNGDRATAQKLFRQVLSIDPHNADANFNLGAMAEDSGDLNGALYYYQTAQRLSPSDSDVADAVKSVQTKIKQQQVTQQTTTELKEKERLRGIAQDAAAAYKQGQYDRAISDLQEVLRHDPNDPNALFGLAQAYRGKNDLNSAKRYLSQALSIDPNNQLYQATMRDMDQDARSAAHSGSGQVADMPPAAPDYRSGANSDYYGRQSPSTGWQSADASQPAGQLTPFTDQGANQLQGHASRYGGMGGGMMGPMAGGLIAGGLSRMMYPGYGSYYGGTGSRLVRGGLVGGLAGAAIGGLMNMNGPGGFRAGAMRGGLTGGLMGLITGF